MPETTPTAKPTTKPNLKPTTPAQYLKSLPEDRRKALAAVREVVNANLPKGYREGMQYGMIGWFVPHSVYPAGYHCDPWQPLPFVSVASQKNHMALYLFCVYTDPKLLDWFVKSWKASGRKLDMGKSCVRFKTIEDVSLEVVGELVSRVSVDAFVRSYKAGVPGAGNRGGKKAAKKAAKKTAKKVAKKAAAKKLSKKKAVAKKKAVGKKASARRGDAR